jgi:hypothetical protein
MYKTTFERVHEIVITIAIILGMGEVILGVLAIMIPSLNDILLSQINARILVYGFALFLIYSVFRVIIKITKTLKVNISLYSVLPSKEIRYLLEAVNSYQNELDEYYSDTGSEFDASMTYHLTKSKLISFIKKSKSLFNTIIKAKEVPFQILFYRTILYFYRREITNYSNFTFESKGCRLIICHALDMLISHGDTNKESRKLILNEIDNKISDLY